MGSPSVPQAPSTGNAQNIFNSGLNSQYNLANTAQGYTNNILNNQYAGGYQGGANTAGSYLSNTLAPQYQNQSSALNSAASAGLPYASQILQAGFDPQNALYNRTENQVQQQAGAQLASSGVGATPYGQSVMGQDLSNFNIDWQNNQLSREAQAGSAYDSMLGSAGQAFTTAGQLGTAGADATMAGGSLPYSTSNSINSTDVGALGTQQGLYSGPTSTAGNWVQSIFGDQMQQYGAEEQQNQSLWGDIGGGLGSLAGMFGLGSGGLGSLLGLGMGATTNTLLPSYTLGSGAYGY